MYNQGNNRGHRDQVEGLSNKQPHLAHRCTIQIEEHCGWRSFENRPEPAEVEEWGAELPEMSVVRLPGVLRKRTPYLRNLRKDRSEVFCGYPQMRSSSEEEEETQ